MMVLSCELNNVRGSKDGNELFTHIDLFFRECKQFKCAERVSQYINQLCT